MFDVLVKPKFLKKCNSAIKMIKLRLEIIKKKRNAVEKYLKNDVADLLKNGLDYNAYTRAEGLLTEKKRTACYDFIEEFCDCISKHISVMQKQSECPDECREAVPSLIYAAARFADLPELRDLRAVFYEKYGNNLESFLNQEFAQKLKAEPPTKEMKLQLMHDIAQEFSIEWDSKALEQKLFKPPPLEQKEARNKSSDVADGDKYNLYGSKNDAFKESNNYDDGNGLGNLHEYRKPKRCETDLTSRGGLDDADDKCKMNSSGEGDVSEQDIPRTSSTSDESISEDGIENRKPFYYRSIPPPYVRPSLGKEKGIREETKAPSGSTDNDKNNEQNVSLGESKLEPRSVRRRPFRLPLVSKGLSCVWNNSAANISLTSTQMEEGDKRDEEEKKMDDLLVHYSKKKSPFEWMSKWKTAFLATTRRREPEDASQDSGLRSTKSDPSSLPDRVASSTDRAERHTRASSFQPDILAGHVHPKLPDYDDLAIRLAALRKR